MDENCANCSANIWLIRWEMAEVHFKKYDKVFSVLMGLCILIFFSALGTVANIICWKFFSTKKNVYFTCFRIVTTCDIVICFLSTFYGLSYIFQRQPLMFQNQPFCVSWCLIWQTFMKYSLHLVAIQSVLRTRNIFYNLRLVSIRALILILAVDALLMFTPFLFVRLVSAAIEDSQNFEIRTGIGYVKSLASCTRIYQKPTMDILVIQSIIILLPMPVIIVCCALCFWALLKQNRAATRSMRGLSRVNAKRRWSINSILVFSLTCLILNIPYNYLLFKQIIRHSLNFSEQIKESSINVDVMMTMFGHAFITRVNVSINSFINPLIFFWRIADCRTYLHESWTTFLSSKLISCAGVTANIVTMVTRSLLLPLRGFIARFSSNSHVATINEAAIELSYLGENSCSGVVAKCRCECCYFRENNVVQPDEDVRENAIVLANMNLAHQALQWDSEAV